MACTVDFRCLDEGFGGKTFKRKRESQEQAAAVESIAGDEASMDIDSIQPPSAKRSAVASSEDPDKPVSVAIERPTYDGVISGKVSGRPWKQPRAHRASGRFVRNKGRADLEEMKRQREIKRAYRERMGELKEEEQGREGEEEGGECFEDGDEAAEDYQPQDVEEDCQV
ncbi:hypothetical protein Bca4012_082205 [Brassica carinata]